MDIFVCIKLIVKAQMMLDTNKLSLRMQNKQINYTTVNQYFQISKKLPMNHPHIATSEVIYLQLDAIRSEYFLKNTKQKEINTFNLMWTTHYCKTLKAWKI